MLPAQPSLTALNQAKFTIILTFAAEKIFTRLSGTPESMFLTGLFPAHCTLKQPGGLRSAITAAMARLGPIGCLQRSVARNVTPLLPRTRVL